MTMGIVGVLLVVWAIALFVMYHKIFTVFYVDLTRGIGKEIRTESRLHVRKAADAAEQGLQARILGDQSIQQEERDVG